MAAFESFFYENFADEIENGKIIRILDIGGTHAFWNSIGFKYSKNCEFTLLNLADIEIPEGVTGFKSIRGIEHVGKKPEWKKMVSEMRRTGKYYFLQTPNRAFFMEPHFLMPWFQFLPLKMKAFILLHFRFGWFKYIRTREEALEAADSIHLLSHKDVKELFPDGTIKKERFLGMTKSFMVMGKTS